MKHDTERAERAMRTTFFNIWIIIGVIIISSPNNRAASSLNAI